MILEYYGGYLEKEDIRELFHTDRNGTSAYHFVEGVKSIGFSAKGVSCPLESFLNEEILYPCIANVTLNQSYSHFVVIYEMNKKKKEFIIADPANKIIKMKLDVFKEIYSGNLIILYPEKPLLHFEKEKFSWQNMVGLLIGSQRFITSILLLSFFILSYSVVTSFYSEMMLKNLQLEEQESFFLFLFVVFSVLTFLKLTSEFLRTRLFLWIEKKIDIILTEDTFRKVLFLPYKYYHNHTAGDILTRIQGIDDVKVAISKWIMIIIVDIPLMVISFFMLYILHSKLAMLVLIFFIFQILILKILKKPLEEKIEECQKQNATLASLEVESIRSFETVKGISIESYFHQKLIQERVLFLKKLHQLENLLTLENYGKGLCREFSSLLLLLFGCLFVRQGTLEFSTLLTIQTLAMYFYTPVEEFIDLDKETKQAQNAWRRLAILAKKEVSFGYLKKLELDTIIFKNINYSYRPDIEILHHVSFTISKGEKVLVLGNSGSGKSTLFKLLKRYYELPRNKIIIGKNDLNDYDNTNLISYVNQTENLYTGSLMENLLLGSDLEENYFKKVIRICNVNEIVDKNRLGFYQLIEENGMNLSGGERQRIILARTLLKKFSILIIDEGLNQVDVNLERKILKSLFREFYDKTIIIISHREENMDLFHHKIRLEQGKVIEDIRKNGKYKVLPPS